jgi:molybdate transport system substrate-binding protein
MQSLMLVTMVGAIIPPGKPAPQREKVTVFAAASLTAAFNEIADTLRHHDPTVEIAFNFAGSQALALQIQQGAPADVFASADDHWMKVVHDAGLTKGAPAVFVHNHLVVIVPKENPAHIVTLHDLAKPGVKLVLADPAVPVGHYARTTIDALAKQPGFPANYAEDVNARVVSNEDNVKGVVAKVQLGEADAGIVYLSDVTPAVAKAVTRIAIPEPANPLADYPIAVLRRSTSKAAEAFVQLVLSPSGQDVLARNGFVPVRASH